MLWLGIGITWLIFIVMICIWNHGAHMNDDFTEVNPNERRVSTGE